MYEQIFAIKLTAEQLPKTRHDWLFSDAYKECIVLTFVQVLNEVEPSDEEYSDDDDDASPTGRSSAHVKR